MNRKKEMWKEIKTEERNIQWINESKKENEWNKEKN